MVMKEDQPSPLLVMLKMRKHVSCFMVGMVANFWDKTEQVVNEIIAKNNWCPTPVKFVGKWAEGAKNCCNALEERMDKEFDGLEKFLGAREKDQDTTSRQKPQKS
jgi:hypothetical protein